MSDVHYTVSEWEDALEQAEIANWMAGDPDLKDWPLSVWLCEQRNHHPSVADDDSVLEAAINVLGEVEERESFSPEEFVDVLSSYKDSTSDDFEELVEEYARENGDDALADLVRRSVSAEDCERWYVDYVRSENDVCAEISAGGTLYWFDKSKW